MSDPLICVGCEIAGGGGQLSTILSIVGAATGIAGALTGVLAFLNSQSNHDSTIFREEFDRHRVPLETSLQTIKRHMVTLRGSNHALLAIGTIHGNFTAAARETRQAVETILSEADDIDQRGLISAKWLPTLSPLQGSIEQAWAVLDDVNEAEAARRQSASTIIANLEALASTTRSQIESCVRTPLTKGRWRKLPRT